MAATYSPNDGIPLDPFAATALSREDAQLYLERIALPASTVDEKPSLELLARIKQTHLEQVAKDTSPLHVKEDEWYGPNVPIKLSSNFPGMPESTAAFNRIVKERKGAFCFAVNATFAALLRTFGFRVSELVGRTFKSLGNDPLTHQDGWKWGTFTHELLIVDWEGSDGRYMVDAMWGPWACPVPIKLVDGETVLGLNPYEAFRVKYEYLPLSADQTQPVDTIQGWTLYRFIPPPETPLFLPFSSSTPGFWSPQFHVYPLSCSLLDFRLYHHFSASHELATFTAFWLVTKVIPGTGGARRSMMYAEKPGQPRRAKVYTTGGIEGKGSLEGRDVEWVEMETQPMRAFLEREFGFSF
ncbi:hypothetical protein JCM6882_000430 [Rhodosporidiobolus microsporus]